jgi:hypothetical protein
MRVENVFAAATNRFSDWGLDRTADGKVVSPHPIIIVPFLPFESLSFTATTVVKGCWFALLGLLLAGLFGCVRVLVREGG